MIKIALPAGDLRTPVADALSAAGLHVEGYGEGSRQYRLPTRGRDDVKVRVFREKDIPIQVALGNYDIGITSVAWVQEIQCRFPLQPLVALGDLGIGASRVVAASCAGHVPSLADIGALARVRLASEYPNIAEQFARAARFGHYRVQAVWGAAHAYPPEDADVVIINVGDDSFLAEHGLTELISILGNSAWVIANANSLAAKDLQSVLEPVLAAGRGAVNGALRLPPPIPMRPNGRARQKRETVRMAIPDGHQQRHVYEALQDAGLSFQGYEEKTHVRRPESGIDGLDVKVVRPQDMPQLVANGDFDIAITGRDLLNEHLYQFPSSPACEIIDLQRAQYNMSAVVDGNLPADNLAGALDYWRKQDREALTVAAEFPATADHYARSRHFWRYRVIPIAGASEGFVPEDAEILIEGTETGRTIAENNLKVIDLLYRSTSAVIAHRNPDFSPGQQKVFDHVRGALQKAAGAA
ncbi:MAG TPA: ATP phosphoribosyltransferase [Dehalococcoidia bacterium]|nr:ATP phosphoribosyltransferase [Dehalococcoidia bacterium]